MLEAAGVSFRVQASNVDERQVEAGLAGADTASVAIALAAAKAGAVDAPGDIVLGSDSLVVVDRQRFDKPSSREEAAEHLRRFSGRVMELHSAAALYRDGDRVWSSTSLARLHVRDLSEDFIERYLDAEWPHVAHCVGVFRIEALGVQLFERIDGDHFTVLGMPLIEVLGALRDLGELAA